MVQIIPKQGNLSSRLGSGIGQGLGQGFAEQFPKELERSRLSQGLQQFSKQSGNMTPMEQLAYISSQPGVTPQMIQSFAELAKQQGIKNAFQGKTRKDLQQQANPTNTTEQFRDAIRDITLGGASKERPINRASQGSPIRDNVSPDEFGQPQVNPNNPLRESTTPKSPWTLERRNQEISKIFDEIPGITFNEASTEAANREHRELAQPISEQAKDKKLEEDKSSMKKNFLAELSTKLQKGDKEGLFKDISGEDLINLQRGMEKDLRTDPKASVDDVVNKWTNKALNMAKAKTQLKTLKGDFAAFPVLLRRGSYRDKFSNYQKIYEDAGNSEEYFNTLKSDFGFSPQGAASLAYRRSPKVKEYIDKVKSTSYNLKDPGAQSRKKAVDIENLITSGDSLLAIARDLRERDQFFDQEAFFKELSDDQDSLPLNARQRRELAEGVSGIFPNWADLLVLPIFRTEQ